jgi:hypothetical protein
MGNIDYLSDNLVVMAGPVLAETGLPTSATPSGGVEAKLYDCALDCRVGEYKTVLSADAAEDANSVFIADIGTVNVGAEILIKMDNSYEFREDVSAINGATGEVTWVGNGLAEAASKGNSFTVIKYGESVLKLQVDNIDLWEPGMNLEVTEDDGSVKEEVVILVERDLGYLKGSSGITGVSSTLSAGNLVKRRLGATGADDITLAAFGTPFPTTVATTEAGDERWGFRGTVPHDHPDLQLGMRVRAEITFLDGGTNIKRKTVGTVINE